MTGPATQTEQVYNTSDKRPMRYLYGKDDIYYDNDKATTKGEHSAESLKKKLKKA